MGNAAAGAGGGGILKKGKKAKVMKVNGELLKLNTPAKAGDITKDYPGHILLDSDDFLRYNLRSEPLSPESDLLPGHIYLLVHLPEFPSASASASAPAPAPALVERTRNSDVDATTCSTTTSTRPDDDGDRSRIYRRSVSDPSISGGLRIKVRLPKAEVKRIVEESKDDSQIARLIFSLYNNGRDGYG